MTTITLHPFIYYSMLSIMVILFGCVMWLLYLFLAQISGDIIILIDKTNRWKIVRKKLKDSSDVNIEDKKYLLTEKYALLNSKGKALFIFSQNKPEPMKIEYNKASWLDSESLLTIINNKLIQKLVQTADSFKDTLLLFGSIGGILAGISSVLILLKQFEVI